MMYMVELGREIELQPCFFGPRLREVLEQKLHSEVGSYVIPMPLMPLVKCGASQDCGVYPSLACSPFQSELLSSPDDIVQVEGTCSGKCGFLICVTGMGDVSKGSIREGLGTALFNVHYSCLVLRPHKGEVMDCVVTSVSKVRPRPSWR